MDKYWEILKQWAGKNNEKTILNKFVNYTPITGKRN